MAHSYLVLLAFPLTARKLCLQKILQAVSYHLPNDDALIDPISRIRTHSIKHLEMFSCQSQDQSCAYYTSFRVSFEPKLFLPLADSMITLVSL